MQKVDLELYTDYLLSTSGAATATGLSAMLEGQVSHDRITRFLAERDYTSKDLWRQVKSTVRRIEDGEGVLIFDDTIQEKAWTDESDLICWHYDHCQGRSVKGINLLNALYHCNGRSIPVAFELVTKPYQYCDLVTRQVKRKSAKTKNELMREMIGVCIQNALKFRFVLMDSWFAAQENFEYITGKRKHFIAALKSNRLVAVSEKDRKAKRFVAVDELEFTGHGVVQGWLNGYAKEVRLVRQVFTNKDASTGTLYLVCSDITCDYDTITSSQTLTCGEWPIRVIAALRISACVGAVSEPRSRAGTRLSARCCARIRPQGVVTFARHRHLAIAHQTQSPTNQRVLAFSHPLWHLLFLLCH